MSEMRVGHKLTGEELTGMVIKKWEKESAIMTRR